jgi:hypothetical protein
MMLVDLFNAPLWVFLYQLISIEVVDSVALPSRLACASFPSVILPSASPAGSSPSRRGGRFGVPCHLAMRVGRNSGCVILVA